MAGKISPAAQQQIATFEKFTNDVGRINSLIEQFAAAKAGHENLRAMIKRSAGQAKLKFMTSGLASLSQICGSIELAAARTAPPAAQARTFRELMGQLKFGIELGIRTILREDEELQTKKKKAKQDAQDV